MRIEADPTGLRSTAGDLDRTLIELRDALAALSGPADVATQGAGLAATAFESMWAAWSSVLPGLAGRLEATAAALRLAAQSYASVDSLAVPPPDT